MAYYIEEFKSTEDIISQYATPADALKDAEVLLAWYGYGSYYGSSLVVFKQDGKLFEVNGSHCSCYGLEGQWKPEETSWKVLAIRNLSDECGGSDEADKALAVLVRQNLTAAEIADAFAAVKSSRRR